MTASEQTLNDYLLLGWKIFPCHSIVNAECTCGNLNCDAPGKHPRTYNGVKAATDDIDQIRAWDRQWVNINWALATGAPSGVIAIDIDERKDGFASFDEYEQMRRGNGSFADTLIASTGGGGRHIFIKVDSGVRNRVNWLSGVDIRGDGGYVILPPGLHVSGRSYTWTNWGVPIMHAPADFMHAMAEGGNYGVDASIIKDLSVDDFIDGVEEGGRDDTIFRMACRLRRQLADNRAAITVLCLQAAANSVPPFPPDEAMRKIDQAFDQDHTDLTERVFQGDDTNGNPLAHLTDMGNRDRFVNLFGDDYRYIVGMGWYKWGDDGWHRVDDLVPHRDAQQVPDVIRDEANFITDLPTRQQFVKWAKDTESASKLTAIVSLAKGHERFRKTVDDFDNDIYSLACANGMVNLRTGDVRAFSRTDLFTKNTRTVYEPGFKLEKWDNFMNDVTDGDDELKEYLQMSAGYSLTGSVQEECFFIVSGYKQTGKSTFVTALESMLGSYHQTVAPDLLLKRYGKDTPRDELVKLAGSRMVSAEEIPEDAIFDDALLKRITGGSTLSARYLYQEAFDFMPQFKLWLATNFDPVTQDSAMFRRIKRIPFLVLIPDSRKDRTLKHFVRDRSSGGKAVLAWAVEGAIKYLEAGKLETPDKIRFSTISYEREQDSFSHFLNETFEYVDGERIPESTAFKLYSDWARNNAERQIKRPHFARKMRERGYELLIDEISQTRYVPNLRVRLAHVFV